MTDAPIYADPPYPAETAAIPVIKRLREDFGMGLREAKGAFDAMRVTFFPGRGYKADYYELVPVGVNPLPVKSAPIDPLGNTCVYCKANLYGSSAGFFFCDTYCFEDNQKKIMRQYTTKVAKARVADLETSLAGARAELARLEGEF